MEDIPKQYKFERPGFTTEINKLVQHFQSKYARNWSEFTKKKAKISFNGTNIDSKQYPWYLIQEAHKNFPKWYESHAKIFEIDPNFFLE